MDCLYTDERNAQIVIALLKAHNIKKVIASPGTTNICLIASIQNDSFFEIYSAPDERSGAYIACGLAAETGEPVVLSCTGATASRNYLPALTEAYYRKLPVLAITSSRRSDRIGHNFDQVTDRTVLPNDVVKLSVQMPVVHDEESEWGCMIAANKAMLELRRHGGGPVHINLETMYSAKCDVKEIPPVRAIFRYTSKDSLPEILAERIAIVVGAHIKWDEQLTKVVEEFCDRYNAVVMGDHTSNYRGKYYINPNLATHQKNYISVAKKADLIIHIGDISSSEYGIKAQNVWRVNPDGEIRDTFWKLKYVFEFQEEAFFERYVSCSKIKKNNTFYAECIQEENEIYDKIPELPFSNAWIASVTSCELPNDAVLHLGIRNSLRSWNFFKVPESVLGYSNTGGFGIDGCMSSTIGASLADKNRIYYCVLGDLAFFYDLNSLGNRHIGNNVRILLVNNGTGMEMKFSSFLGSTMGAELNRYICATGHYGNKSFDLVKHYAQDLGFEYLSAKNKEEYLQNKGKFLSNKLTEKPIIFEVFVDDKDEDKAFELLAQIKTDQKQVAKNALRGVLGDDKIKMIKSIMRK